MSAKEFTILPPFEFISDVLKEASHAKKRIYLQAMDVGPGEISDHLLNILSEGTKKGLETKLHVDHYSFLITDDMFNYIPLFSKKKETKRRKGLEQKKEYFQSLQNLGVHITFTNPPSILSKILPTFGRNHIKIAIVDDSAWIGGINFVDHNFKSNDCMVKLSDPLIVEPIVTLYNDFEGGRIAADRRIECTEKTTLFVDSGKVGKSVILDHAEELIDKATNSVTVITPIIPDTQLSRALARAKKRGISLKIVVPKIQKMKGVYAILDMFNQAGLQVQRKKIPLSFKDHFIHAKMMIVDEKIVLLGSHNLTNRGVLMGTEELAISSTNPYFLRQATSFMNHILHK